MFLLNWSNSVLPSHERTLAKKLRISSCNHVTEGKNNTRTKLFKNKIHKQLNVKDFSAMNIVHKSLVYLISYALNVLANL